MAKEIERKFLVKGDSYKKMASKSYPILQGYLTRSETAVVRVRKKGEEAFLTIKGPNALAVRDEWEYPIPAEDAAEMLEKLSSGSIIDKTRYIVEYRGHTWEIDEFHGKLQGLTVAEIELGSEQEQFEKPAFISQEVTGDPYYYNSNLAKS